MGLWKVWCVRDARCKTELATDSGVDCLNVDEPNQRASLSGSTGLPPPSPTLAIGEDVEGGEGGGEGYQGEDEQGLEDLETQL